MKTLLAFIISTAVIISSGITANAKDIITVPKTVQTNSNHKAIIKGTTKKNTKVKYGVLKSVKSDRHGKYKITIKNKSTSDTTETITVKVDSKKIKRTVTIKPYKYSNVSSSSSVDSSRNQINTAIATDLSERKSSADPEAVWSQLIEKIEYDSDGQLSVYVNGDFLNASDTEKNSTIKKAQNVATTEIGPVKNWDSSDSQEGIMTTVYNGQNIVGQSKMLNHKEFKWQ